MSAVAGLPEDPVRGVGRHVPPQRAVPRRHPPEDHAPCVGVEDVEHSGEDPTCHPVTGVAVVHDDRRRELAGAAVGGVADDLLTVLRRQDLLRRTRLQEQLPRPVRVHAEHLRPVLGLGVEDRDQVVLTGGSEQPRESPATGTRTSPSRIVSSTMTATCGFSPRGSAPGWICTVGAAATATSANVSGATPALVEAPATSADTARVGVTTATASAAVSRRVGCAHGGSSRSCGRWCLLIH